MYVFFGNELKQYDNINKYVFQFWSNDGSQLGNDILSVLCADFASRQLSIIVLSAPGTAA
jgi:hypothetical protein